MPTIRAQTRRVPQTGEKNSETRISGPSAPLPLPHERDESPREQEHHDIDSRIEQAEDDLRQGKRDTEARTTATAQFNRRWQGSKRR